MQRIAATEIQRQWEDTLGVKVELVFFDTYAVYIETMSTNPTHVYQRSWRGFYNDAHAYLNLRGLFSELLARSGWEDAEFTKLIEDAARTTDQMERNQLYAKAEEILVKTQAVVLPMMWEQEKYLTHPYVNSTDSHLRHLDRFEKWSIIIH